MSTDKLPRQFLYSMRSLLGAVWGDSFLLGSFLTNYKYSRPLSFGFQISYFSFYYLQALSFNYLYSFSSISLRLFSSIYGTNFVLTSQENCLIFYSLCLGCCSAYYSGREAICLQKALLQEGLYLFLEPLIFFSIQRTDSFCFSVSSTLCQCSSISCRLMGCFNCLISASFFFLSSKTSSSFSMNFYYSL